MIFKNIDFHNVMELEQVDGFSGLRLQRFPKNIRNALGYKEHIKGRFVAQTSTGCEIRFITSGNSARISLSSLDDDGDVIVYKGNFFHSHYKLKTGVISTLHLEGTMPFSEVKPDVLQGFPFSSSLWRVLIAGRYCAVFHGIDSFGYDLRPPYKNEVPAARWLAYGSSITHGSAAFFHSNSYIQQAAKRLKVDVLCNGLGGSCICEREMADFLAERGDWDFITLELGVNMRLLFTEKEFEERTGYLIKTLLAKNPDKPVVIITIFPNRSDCFLKEKQIVAVRNRAFNEILRNIYSDIYNKNLYLIKGSDLLTDFSGLTCDLLHPSDYGHIIMGENLAFKLKSILPVCKE